MEGIYKMKIYSGQKNEIVRNSSYIGSFLCSFSNIGLYPFDIELCHLKLMMPNKIYDRARLVPSKLEFTGSKHVGQYIIVQQQMKTKKFQNGREGVQVEIKLGRQIGSILLSTYLPTILMNLINQATNYFEGEDLFGDIIAINLTCMMVLSAMYISVSGSLPTTASIKYIEIWLLFNLIYPFLIILAQTCLHLAKNEEKKKTYVNPCQR